MKKAAILKVMVGVIASALILTVILLANNQDIQAPSDRAEPSVVQTDTAADDSTATIVYYEDRGFEPSEITVKQGKTVTFKVPADAEIPVWVASDPHPAHTDYPEFDAARILDTLPSPGEGYSFTFDQVGVWKFHNHTAPEHTGVVNVIE